MFHVKHLTTYSYLIDVDVSRETFINYSN